MITSTTPELLESVLRRYFHVEVLSGDWQEVLQRELNFVGAPTRAAEFRRQLSDAILKRSITPAEYERLTEDELETQDEVEERLMYLWMGLYGDEPVTRDTKQYAIRV